MATVNQCDRCNKVYPMYSGGLACVKVSVKGEYLFPEDFDLCPECYKAFQNFMKGANTNEPR